MIQKVSEGFFFLAISGASDFGGSADFRAVLTNNLVPNFIVNAWKLSQSDWRLDMRDFRVSNGLRAQH
jgi:hypothetical protein